PEMPHPQGTKPPGRTHCCNTSFDNVGRTVWDIASGDRDRLRARIARRGISATQVIGRDVMIEARSRKRRIQSGVYPWADTERVSPFDASAGRCPARTRNAGITVEY